MTGVGAPDFTLASDAEAVRIEPKAAPTQRFVALVRTVPADGLVGKEITATFLVRADGLEKPGMCILKVQAEPALAYQGFLAGDFKEIAASTKGFVPCTVSTKVPDGARWILFGATYRGNGKIWVKSPALNPGAPKG
ncbi:MAG: hypothetical protein HOW73_18890 [Polyangiaceae bacterium]|nr:hypothetical protein [Polyangiaceae bacterium]